MFQGATLVMQVTLNTATGAYTVTQVAPIDHAAGAGRKQPALHASTTASPIRTATVATGTLAVDVDDDTPIAANDTDCGDRGRPD